jgi:hypothetical protein
METDMSKLPVMIKVDAEGKVVDQVKLEDVIKFLEAKKQESTKARHPILCRDVETGEEKMYETMSAEVGNKYIKVVVTHGPMSGGQRSVYCFFDFLGNIYKAASWKAPAKHIRGSVFDKDHSWGKALSDYGAVYLK